MDLAGQAEGIRATREKMTGEPEQNRAAAGPAPRKQAAAKSPEAPDETRQERRQYGQTDEEAGSKAKRGTHKAKNDHTCTHTQSN